MLKIFVVLLSTFIFQGSIHAADKIRIAYSAGTSSLLFLLTHKHGFLKAEGVDAEVIRMTGNVPVAALVSGEIDYHTSASAGIRAAIQGLPLRVVAVYGEGSGWVLVSRPSIKSVPELKGKVIAVGNPGTGPDTNGRIMVKHFGLEPDRDVKFVAAAEGLPEGRLVRVQQGFIDATVVPIPADVSAKRLGLNVIARSEDIYKLADFGLLTTTRKIKEKRDEIKRTIVRRLKAAVTSGQIAKRRSSRSWSYLRRIVRWLEQTTSIFLKPSTAMVVQPRRAFGCSLRMQSRRLR
jgi:NitT/TauT family transport system substrate-binding protein